MVSEPGTALGQPRSAPAAGRALRSKQPHRRQRARGPAPALALRTASVLEHTTQAGKLPSATNDAALLLSH